MPTEPCRRGATITLVLGATAAALALALLVHHRVKHDKDTHLSQGQKWFQLSDVDNHETWEVALLSVALTSVITFFVTKSCVGAA